MGSGRYGLRAFDRTRKYHDFKCMAEMPREKIPCPAARIAVIYRAMMSMATGALRGGKQVFMSQAW